MDDIFLCLFPINLYIIIMVIHMKKFTYFIPSILLMIMIFSFSMQNGEQSSGLSLQIVYFMKKIFPFITNLDLLHLIIRKIAHMSEYALLTLSFIYGFYKNDMTWKKIYTYSLYCSFLYACSDELHQLFVSQRAGQFHDVLIDTCGAILMIILIIGIRGIKKTI